VILFTALLFAIVSFENSGANLMRLFEGTQFDVPPQCERCEQLESECQCPPIEPTKQLVSPSKQTARITIEKRKKGKIVTLISGLAADANDLSSLCTQLKNGCGAGGTTQQDIVEIQGEHAQRVSEILSEIGYRIKVVNSHVKKKP